MIILAINPNLSDLFYNLCLYCLYLILTLWGTMHIYTHIFSIQ